MSNKDIKYRNAESRLHRTDGPAVEYANGSKCWYKEDKYHRTDGPAAEYANGTKHWYKDGKLHRTDGPPIESYNGSKYWYIDGIEYSLEAYIDLVPEEVQIDIVLNHLPGFKTNEQ